MCVELKLPAERENSVSDISVQIELWEKVKEIKHREKKIYPTNKVM